MHTYTKMAARADRRRRFLALVVTIAFHAGLLAFFLGGNETSWTEKLPTFVQEAFDLNEDTAAKDAEEVAEIKP